MLLRRSRKKKQKKALEAQQAAMAAMQGVPTYPYPRPPSAMSVPAMLHDQNDEGEPLDQSGSDDMEMMESLSLTGEVGYTQQKTDIVSPQINPHQSLPFTHQSTAPPLVPVFSQPAPIPATTSSSYKLPPSDHLLKRIQSQPAQLAQMQMLPQPVPMANTTTIPEYTITQPSIKETVPVTTYNSLPRGFKTNNVSGSKRSYHSQPKIDPAKAELIKTAVYLGLGRGIDATKKNPWANKTSFQVRRVHNSVVETNEGGTLETYDHEILSIASLDEQFQASLNPPECPINIHVEADINRCVNSSRYTIGKRVLTRTMGFQTDIEEKYTDGESHRNGKETHLVPRDPTEIVYNSQNSCLTFEERLYHWLLQRIAHKCALIGQRIDIRNDENYADQLTKFLHSSKTFTRVDEEIKAGCREIVQSLRITHYVTSIRLGASEYRVMSEGEYHKQLALGGAFGLDTLAVEATTGFTKQTKKEASRCSQLRKIGCIDENDKVEKGSEGETVLTLQVQPITRLIRVPAVKAAMIGAVENYMERTSAAEGGPFIIKCTGRNIYLTVNKYNNYEVEGTEVPAEASLFYFQTTDDGGNPFDFHIAYYGEDVGPGEASDKINDIGRYLEVTVNSKGYCPGPLLMKHSVKVRNTRFTLRSRLSKKYSSSHLSQWIAGEDAFYIACATRRFQHGSYLAVKNSARSTLLGKHFFITECVPDIHKHNGDNMFMLFQLLTKDSVEAKAGEGRETPGKLPVHPTELTTREKDPITSSQHQLLAQ